MRRAALVLTLLLPSLALSEEAAPRGYGEISEVHCPNCTTVAPKRRSASRELKAGKAHHKVDRGA